MVIWICFAIFRKLGDKRWEKRGELLDNYITLAWRASLARDRIAKLEATQGEYTGAFEALKWQVDCVDEYGSMTGSLIVNSWYRSITPRQVFIAINLNVIDAGNYALGYGPISQWPTGRH